MLGEVCTVFHFTNENTEDQKHLVVCQGHALLDLHITFCVLICVAITCQIVTVPDMAVGAKHIRINENFRELTVLWSHGK